MPRHWSSFVLLSLTALAACGTDSERQVSRTLDRYKGASEEMAMISLGKPTRHTTLADGRRTVTFVVSRMVRTGGFHIPISQEQRVTGTSFGPRGMSSYSETRTISADGPWVPSGSMEMSCTIVFDLSPAGFLSDYAYYEGDSGSLDKGYICSQALGAG